MNKVKLIEQSHTSTSRKYLERMVDDKVHCMDVAQNFEEDYWDGDRRYGYGGYSYDGRWRPIALKVIEKYKLTKASSVIDVGCGMGHLIYEIKNEIDCKVVGLDISKYAKEKSPISDNINLVDVRGGINFKDNEFDLALSIMTLHNFEIHELDNVLHDIERVAKNKFIAVESYRNNTELFNLQCWALTCHSFLSPSAWEYMLNNTSFSGDYEFLYFE